MTTGEKVWPPHVDYDEEIFSEVEHEMAAALNGSTLDLYRALTFLYPSIPKDGLKAFVLDMPYRTSYKRLLCRLRVMGPSLETLLTTKRATTCPQ